MRQTGLVGYWKLLQNPVYSPFDATLLESSDFSCAQRREQSSRLVSEQLSHSFDFGFHALDVPPSGCGDLLLHGLVGVSFPLLV